MKKLHHTILIFSLLVYMVSCNRNAEVIRQLHYVDLLNPDNKSFFKYPDEFSSYLLKGVLKNDLKVFYIDYDSSGQISPLTLQEFKRNILEPYEYYEDDQEFDEPEYEEDPSIFLSSITLLSFDNLVQENKEFTQYINFYHPADVTPEGINKYIGSVKFESALGYLNKANPPFLWNNFRVFDWGWFKDRIFVSDISTSSRLAVDLIELSDNGTLSSSLSDSLTLEEIKSMAEQNPFYFSSKINSSGNTGIDVIYKNDSVLMKIGSFSFEDLEKISGKKDEQDSVVILPVSTAILENRLKMDRIKRISRNGSFDKPLKGEDELSRKSPGEIDVDKTSFPGSQKFYFRTIERLIGENFPGLDVLPEQLYDGVKKGTITVYRDDSLKRRLLPGEFFDNMIIDIDENIPADAKSLIVYSVVTETIFQLNGKTNERVPLGIGLFLPGNLVPEGFNRPVGYFRIDEIEEFQSQNGFEVLSYGELNGYPLSSWHIQVY